MSEPYDIAIVGAGPTGLAAAMAANRSGLSNVIFDKGSVVNTIVGYPIGMTFFSTPELLSIGGVPFATPRTRPTREEAIVYYRAAARSAGVSVRQQTAVHAIEAAAGSFQVITDDGVVTARHVIVATGYFDNTNRLGVHGEDLPHVHHYYDEPYRWYDRDVVVIGGRNSAVEVALDLYRNGARVALVHRGDAFGSGLKYWIRPDIENRIRKGEISMHWRTVVERIEPSSVALRNLETGSATIVPADGVFAMIGYRPDVALLAASGVTYDPETLVPTYDPATFETNVPGLFIAGSVACGCRTWEIFIENGREHAVTVVGEIARRLNPSDMPGGYQGRSRRSVY